MIGSPLARTLAWSVHFYTAFGAVAALEAIVFTVRGDVRGAFLWMAAALAIDSSDGTLARAARVKEVVPTYDGSKLDDIVDYLNYVFVPIFFAVETGLLPAGTAGFVAALPLLASAYGFCVSTAKTADFFFTGFPSYWNVIVFYMYGFDASPTANAARPAPFIRPRVRADRLPLPEPPAVPAPADDHARHRLGGRRDRRRLSACPSDPLFSLRLARVPDLLLRVVLLPPLRTSRALSAKTKSP